MAEAIRRLLGLVPVLLVGSIVLFFLLGRHPEIARAQKLPLFLQRHPVSAASASLSAMRAVARGDASAVQELQDLGGAALPHILPRLSELAPDQRRRVADALEPVALRMQIGSYRSGTSLDAFKGQSDGADQRLLAWERYYEDHDLDFRPLSVERLVRRLSSRRSGTREVDVQAVDTYALPYLVRALGRVDSREDALRVERVVTAISGLSGQSFGLPERPTVSEARTLASRIRRDFDRNGAKFTDAGRLESLTAHVTQTEFGVWWVQTLRELRGIDTPVVFSNLASALSSSAHLLVPAFVGALVLGPLLAGLLHLALLKAFAQPILRRTRRILGLATVVCLPTFCLLGSQSTLLSTAAILFVASLASAATLWAELADGLHWRSGAVLQRRPLPSRLRSIGAALVVTVPTLLPIIAGEIFVWVACIELAGGRDGLFPRALLALEAGEMHALLALSLLSWTCIAVVQTLSDALLSATDRRWRSW